ncbi:MAG: polysaccharide pyruvyl transferase family protein [Tissierellia bacterium]|nr:polysaccharide pyruvyl transferase family protein [Tissierellia bacterium]
MKIGILTQPLINNYGGLLQNYALQKILTELGHEVLTININYSDVSYIRRFASILKRSLLKTFKKNIAIRVYPTNNENEIIAQNTKSFIKKNIKTTRLIKQKVNEELLYEYGFDAYVVGSDQVWRPVFSPQQSTYFLDFLDNNNSVKKIAYAASFGVSNWEFTKKQTQRFGKLIKLFDAVSVREDTAVDLCKEYLYVDAFHLLDPTMLLDKDDYLLLIDEQNIKIKSGNLFTYILDESDEKGLVLKKVAKEYNLNPYRVMPRAKFSDPHKKSIKDCIFPPVEEWIRGFADAQYIVTDSFHGTVFSILFNKPFISIANEGRGVTRLKSLLKLFNLEERLILSPDSFDLNKLKKIDWNEVNSILENEKEKSLLFLKKQLNNIFNN